MVDSQTLARLKAISEKEWGSIAKSLTLYATLKLKGFGFVLRSEKDIKNGEDFANDAIEKLFEGKRRWDFNRFPDLLIHLKGIVKSLISSHLKSSTRSAVRKVDFGDPVDSAEDLENADGLHAESPQQTVITQEIWDQLEKGFSDDVDGFLICCDWLDGNPPREIAKSFGIDVVQVNNAQKKGRRILKQLEPLIRELHGG